MKESSFYGKSQKIVCFLALHASNYRGKELNAFHSRGEFLDSLLRGQLQRESNSPYHAHYGGTPFVAVLLAFDSFDAGGNGAGGSSAHLPLRNLLCNPRDLSWIAGITRHHWYLPTQLYRVSKNQSLSISRIPVIRVGLFNLRVRTPVHGVAFARLLRQLRRYLISCRI